LQCLHHVLWAIEVLAQLQRQLEGARYLRIAVQIVVSDRLF